MNCDAIRHLTESHIGIDLSRTSLQFVSVVLESARQSNFREANDAPNIPDRRPVFHRVCNRH